MPITTRRKKKGKKVCYTNRTPKGVKGKCMTKKNAALQKKLLNAIDHGYVLK